MRSLSKAIFSSAFEICKSSPEGYVQANQGRVQTSVKGLIERQVGQEDGDLDTEVDGAKSCGVASRHMSPWRSTDQVHPGLTVKGSAPNKTRTRPALRFS